MNLRCTVFEYQCQHCGKRFKAPVYTGSGYGQFLMRNYVSGHHVWLDVFSDDVINEMDQLISAHPAVSSLGENAQSDIFQKIVGYLYDPDSEGNYYGIGIDPQCPFCNAHQAKSFREVFPNEYMELSVVRITARQWKQMSQDEKIEKINQLIQGIIM